MKLPYSWLREWVDVPWEARELGARLTMAGFELESLAPAAPAFSGVVVAQIVEVAPHPQADKLRVCRVLTGGTGPAGSIAAGVAGAAAGVAVGAAKAGQAAATAPAADATAMARAVPAAAAASGTAATTVLQIVCGAANAHPGLRTALALVGARLPGDITIGATTLRGVASQGMLCSAKELGLADSSSGILELPADAPLGAPLREYLQLDEAVLEFNVTPNRGDAMSVIGIAREVAALGGGALTGPQLAPVPAQIADRQAVHLNEPGACPRLVGRVIRGIDNTAVTPLWLRERLRRAGVRAISPGVDVTNYVLLELGQPMHAYDLDQVRGAITVRLAQRGEGVTLLDGREVSLEPDMLVIADEAGAVGVAGVMGGQRTAVSAATRDVFLEAAYFAPASIAGRARRLGLHTDASQRFERGVDPAQQERAVERATALLLAIAGGRPGPVVVSEDRAAVPRRGPVRLRRSRLARLLGVGVGDSRVVEIFRALQMTVTPLPEGWSVTPPSHRFDISLEVDLVEEVARIMGLDLIPESAGSARRIFLPLAEELPPERLVLEALAARGYHEAITLAFVDPALQARLFPGEQALALANPIASDLSAMRVSLWPGLVRAALENQRRQQGRIRLFEHGARFAVGAAAAAPDAAPIVTATSTSPPTTTAAATTTTTTTTAAAAAAAGSEQELDSLAGIAVGARLPEQWGSLDGRTGVDFFDVKADLGAVLAATGQGGAFRFEADARSCLHPGRSARIWRDTAAVGWIGELHPRLVRELEFTHPPVLFEIDFCAALRVSVPRAREISRFPQVRRDLALVVPEGVTFSVLRERVVLRASSLLRTLRVFDVYRGAGIEEGTKSVALGLIFQHISRTLTDEEVEGAVAAIVADLRENLNARIRE